LIKKNRYFFLKEERKSF